MAARHTLLTIADIELKKQSEMHEQVLTSYLVVGADIYAPKTMNRNTNWIVLFR